MECIGLRTKLLGDLKLLEIEKRYQMIYNVCSKSKCIGSEILNPTH